MTGSTRTDTGLRASLQAGGLYGAPDRNVNGDFTTGPIPRDLEVIATPLVPASTMRPWQGIDADFGHWISRCRCLRPEARERSIKRHEHPAVITTGHRDTEELSAIPRRRAIVAARENQSLDVIARRRDVKHHQTEPGRTADFLPPGLCVLTSTQAAGSGRGVLTARAAGFLRR